MLSDWKDCFGFDGTIQVQPVYATVDVLDMVGAKPRLLLFRKLLESSFQLGNVGELLGLDAVEFGGRIWAVLGSMQTLNYEDFVFGCYQAQSEPFYNVGYDIVVCTDV